MATELIVVADAVLTMDPTRPVLEPGWLAIDGGRIERVGAGPPPEEHLRRARQVVRGGLAMPGLISAHQHLVDVLVRGVPTGPTFLDWLLGTYYAGLSHATAEDCGVATAYVLAQTLEGGVTTVVDCWGVDGGRDPADLDECAEASLDAHRRSGARVVFARMLADRLPPGWKTFAGPFDARRLVADGGVALAHVEALARRHHGAEDGRIAVTPSPELVELCHPSTLQAAHGLAASLGERLAVHLFPSPASRAAAGPDDLDALGVFDNRLLGAHCTAVDDGDIAALGAAGVHIAHCPTSNAALRGTTTPVARLRRAGCAAGLGIDNASLNASADLLAEARAAVLASRSQEGEDSAPIETADALAMATSEGARAIGRGDDLGVLAPGRRADVTVLDTSGTHWWPRLDWPDAVVWCAGRDDVRTVLVDGRIVVDDGRCTTLDLDPRDLDRRARRIRHAVLDGGPA